jgi:hypothetical protein
MIMAPTTTAATSHRVRVTRDKRRVMLGVLLPSGNGVRVGQLPHPDDQLIGSIGSLLEVAVD